MSTGILCKEVANLDENLNFLSHFLSEHIGLGFFVIK